MYLVNEFSLMISFSFFTVLFLFLSLSLSHSVKGENTALRWIFYLLFLLIFLILFLISGEMLWFFRPTLPYQNIQRIRCYSVFWRNVCFVFCSFYSTVQPKVWPNGATLNVIRQYTCHLLKCHTIKLISHLLHFAPTTECLWLWLVISVMYVFDLN